MTTRRAAARRVEERIANVGAHDNQAPPQDNQVPLLEQVPMGDQVLRVPPPMMDVKIRRFFRFGPTYEFSSKCRYL